MAIAGRRNQQREAARHPPIEIWARKTVRAFVFPPATKSDQFAQISVSFTVRGKQDDFRPVGEADLRPDDQLQATGTCRRMGTHNTRERTFIGDREGGVPERVRTPDEFVGMRGATQEAEIRNAVKLGISRREILHEGSHPYDLTNSIYSRELWRSRVLFRVFQAKTPCRYQPGYSASHSL